MKYEKKSMKTMFGKRYPNCVKKKVKREEYSDWRDENILKVRRSSWKGTKMYFVKESRKQK